MVASGGSRSIQIDALIRRVSRHLCDWHPRVVRDGLSFPHLFGIAKNLSLSLSLSHLCLERLLETTVREGGVALVALVRFLARVNAPGVILRGGSVVRFALC